MMGTFLRTGGVVLLFGSLQVLEAGGGSGPSRDDDEADRGSLPAADAPEPEPPVELPHPEEVAGVDAEDADVADPDRYKRGPGW